MGDFIAQVGELANHLEGVQILSAGVSSSDEDPLYPVTNLAGAKSMDPWRPFRHATPAAADAWVQIDKNFVRNNGAEEGDTSGWTLDLEDPGDPAGSVTVVSSPVKNGTKAFKLTAATGEGGVEAAAMYQDIRIRAGEVGTVEAWIRGDGTRLANVSATILETGTVVLSASEAGTTYTLKTATFTAPAYTKQKPDGIWTLRLRAFITDAANGDAYVDDFVYWPHTNGAAMIGHNIMPVISAFQLRRDTAPTFTADGTLDTTFAPIYSPNFYALLGAMRTERYWRLRAVGTNAGSAQDGGGALWYGQPWLFQKQVFDRSPNYGLSERLAKEYVEQPGSAGTKRRYYQEDTPRTDVVFTWRHPNETDYDEIRDRLFRQGSMGEWPALIIRSTAKPESAHMVLIPGEYLSTFIEAIDARDAGEMVFPGLAYPTFEP